MSTSKSISILKLSTGLAGAIAIAGGTSAYGAIVNVAVPADLTNTAGSPTNTTVNWDVNSDGLFDFTFQNRYPNTAAGNYGVVWQLNMNPATTALATTNGVVSYSGTFVRYASALRAGTTIGTGGPFSTATQVTLGSRYSYGPSGAYNYGGFASGPNAATGAVAPGTQAFAGFRFNAADGTHFGWIQLSVNAGIIDFTNAAYQTTVGASIAAGATAVPEPSTMATLAIGAVGVLGTVAKRRRRAV